MKYPEKERILIVRPCLKAICYRDKSASKLLSLLLFYAKDCDEQEQEFTFTCKQEDLINDLLDEIDIKTLHRTAIPMLRLLGYLDVDGSSYRYTYTVHIGYIQQMLNFYATNKQEIDKCLIDIMQKQLDIYPEQLDIFLKQLDKSRIQLDKCLIPFRQMSNSKRGRKPRPVAALEGNSEEDRYIRDITDTLDNKDSCDAANADITGDIEIHISEVSQDEDSPQKRRAFMAYARRRVAAANKKTRPKPAPSKPVENKPAKPEPTPEEQAFQARCSALQAQINEWRGWTLTVKGAIINERKAIRSLAEQYTDEQIAKIREYLFNKHWRWSKPDNRYTIGGQIILDEAGNVQQILKNASNGHSPGSNGAKPRPSALVSEEQAAKNKARLHERAEAVRAELIRQGKPVPGER